MKLRIIQLFALIFLSASCTPKFNIAFQRTGMVKCIEHDRMTITLSSEGQAETLGKAVSFAERNAFENLLFKGIPNSNQEKPLIQNEIKAKDQYTTFLKGLIDNRGFQEYITSSVVVDDYKNGNIHLVTQQLTIDLTHLRDYLVSNGITRKFGLY